MEEIQRKAFDDELNKSHEEIGQTSSKKFIPVPKQHKKKENEKDSNTETSASTKSGNAR